MPDIGEGFTLFLVSVAGLELGLLKLINASLMGWCGSGVAFSGWRVPLRLSILTWCNGWLGGQSFQGHPVVWVADATSRRKRVDLHGGWALTFRMNSRARRGAPFRTVAPPCGGVLSLRRRIPWRQCRESSAFPGCSTFGIHRIPLSVFDHASAL